MRIERKVVNKTSVKPSTVATINMEGLVLDRQLKEDTLDFRITTYALLSFNGPTVSWDVMFKPINELLATLSDADKILIGEMFVDIKEKIDYIETIDDLTKVTNEISILASDAFDKIRLPEKLLVFVKNSKISIPDLRNVGNQAHHTPEKTFTYEDYIKLTSIVLLCKLFCPVFGEIIATTKKDLDNNLKEIHCIAVLKHIFNNHFGYITDKLQDYLGDTCNNCINKSSPLSTVKVSLTNGYNGFTPEKFGLFVYASMLIKKFVNVDLYGPAGDIVVYIYSCAKGTTDNLVISMQNKNRVLARIAPTDVSIEGNDSLLETESVISNTTVDVPTIIKISTDIVVKEMLVKHNLDVELYEACVDYYRQNMSSVTEINKYILCTFIGNNIGGASGVDLLTIEPYLKLIAVTQLYLVKLNLLDVAHMMSIIPTDKIKSTFTPIDIKIDMNKGASFAYKNCKKMFSYEIGKTAWDNSINEISKNIISIVYTYNTPPVLWEAMGRPVANGTIFQYDESILKDMIEFLNHILEEQLQEEVCLY